MGESELDTVKRLMCEPSTRNIGRVRVAELLGIADHDARKLLKAARDTLPPAQEDSYNYTENDSGAQIETCSEQVRSLDEALAYFDVDLNIWRVKDYIVNQWGRGDMMQVKVRLERSVAQVSVDALKMLVERKLGHVPLRKVPKKKARGDDGGLLVMSLVDQHFGKLAYGEETGDDYNLKIAEGLYVGAMAETLRKSEPYNISRIVLPVGNDLFHFDTGRGRTGNDTQMDFDSRPCKVFVTGCMATVKAIDLAVDSGARVEVLFVPGNHDPTWSHHLSVFLWGWYRDEPRVSVDFSACPDKMIEHGVNFIYFSHLDVSVKNRASLPLYMATRFPEVWARATCREIHGGHFHHEKETSFIPTEEQVGVVLRVLPSLCATDHWHYTMGFKGNRRLTLSLVYGRDTGLEAIIPVSAKSIEST